MAKDQSENNETPPLFRSWNKWYAIVLGFLVLQMAIYFLITVAYR